MATLTEWLALLEVRHPVEIDLGLQRVAEVYKNLGDVRPAPIVITVGGTNGKGSCVRLLEALLTAAGLRVAAYTSPHLISFNERFRIDQCDASDAQLCLAFAAVERARGDTSLSYFEFVTLAGFWLFNQSRVDVALLEVGLGGRLDAVNIVDADVSVITSIDLDHESFLGSTREQVACEKAAIARPGCPLICGETSPPDNLAAEFNRYGCDPLWFGREFSLSVDRASMQGSFVVDGGKTEQLTNLPLSNLPLPSVACALQVYYCLKSRLALAAEARQIGKVLASTGLAGRFQRLNIMNRTVIFDVAHNPAAAQLLARRLHSDNIEPCVAVLAMMKDKAMEEVIDCLVPCVGEWFVGNLSDLPRAASAAQLQQLLYNAGAKVRCTESVATALEMAVNSSDKRATILVFGSFFTVAAAFEWLQSRGIEF